MIKRNKYLLMFVAYVVFTLFLVHFAVAQSYLKGPALIEGVTSTATAAGTTTLTKDSQTNQRFTGVTTQTVVLPDATTLPVGRYFQIENRSTGLVTVQTSGGGALATVLPDMQKQFMVLTIGTAAGTWDVTNLKIDLADVANITGILGAANGGTGLNGSAAANGSLLIGNGTGYSLATITGTANRVTVTNGAGTITLSGPQDIATTSSPTFANETITGDITLSNASFDSLKIGNSLAQLESTGVYSGAVMSVNGGDNTKFDIATGLGYIVDYSTPSAPTINQVTIGPFTAQTVTNLASTDFTWVLIDSAGAIVQQATVPTASQRRTHINLGRLNHSNRTSISFANTLPDFEFSPVSQFGDLMQSLGPFNVGGNIITANGANLSMNKSAGSIFQQSFNYSTVPNSPHIVDTTGLTALTFAYQNQTGGAGGNVTVLDPTTYDNAGTTTTVPASNNATVQRVYLFGSNTIRVQRGQAVYPNFANALQEYSQEVFVESPLIAGFSVPLAYIVMTKSCTSLLNTACSKIITAAKFGGSSGGAGSGGTTNLQQAYNNSVQPQITLNSTQLGIEIRDASTPLGSSLFAIQNNAGSTSYLGVDVNGITASNFVGTGTIGAVRVHNLTTTQKNALTPANGMIVYDSTLGRQECYDGAWKACSSELTTKGDLATYSTTDTRIGVGTNGQVLTADSGQATGLLWANNTAAPDASNDVLNLGLSTSVAANALTITLTDKAGSAPSAGSPVKIGFRNATTTTGNYTVASATAATTMVVSAGSTLGTSNNQTEYIYIYAINNAGTIELAVSRGKFVDEGNILTTTAEGGAGGADSFNTIYSTTARSNVPVRLIGRIIISETTAGTWASNAQVVSPLPFPNGQLQSGLGNNMRIEFATILCDGASSIARQSDLLATVGNAVDAGAYRTCALTFSSPFAASPVCLVSSVDTAVPTMVATQNGTLSVNGVTISGPDAAYVANVMCYGFR